MVGGAAGMTTPTSGELYVRAMNATSRYLDGVRLNQWQGPTPCSEWDVKQVANHIIGENLWAAELFNGKTIEEVGNALDCDLTGDDPAASFRQSVTGASSAVGAPGAMAATCHLSFGDYSGAD